MRLFNFSAPVNILLFFLIWPVIQIGIGWLAGRIPYCRFRKDSFLYRTRTWENGGRIYKRYFKVHRWKRLLPDGGVIMRNGFPKKKLAGRDAAYIQRFVQESCRAELTHWLAILPFWIFGIFTGAIVIPFMFIYAIAVNMPCIITQRYNRPRLEKLLIR